MYLPIFSQLCQKRDVQNNPNADTNLLIEHQDCVVLFQPLPLAEAEIKPRNDVAYIFDE